MKLQVLEKSRPLAKQPIVNERSESRMDQVKPDLPAQSPGERGGTIIRFLAVA
jgi:hypothetical protein